MELNSIIFPSPEFSHDINDHSDELIFIPKIKDLELQKEYDEVIGYIPCLLLQYNKKNLLSKNFLIYYHGNAEDIFFAREIAERIKQNLSINVIIVEYPGYSIYKAEKNGDVVLEDSLFVFDYLTYKLNVEPNHIYVFGRSIGTGPSCYLASKREFAALILMSPFTSIKEVAKNLVGFFSFLVSDRFKNKEYLKNAVCPILFIHGQKDTLIPYQHTIELKSVCTCPLEVVLPDDMDHNRFDYELDLLFPLKEFLKRNTHFNQQDTCSITIPGFLYQIPGNLKDNNEFSSVSDVTYGCFGVK